MTFQQPHQIGKNIWWVNNTHKQWWVLFTHQIETNIFAKKKKWSYAVCDKVVSMAAMLKKKQKVWQKKKNGHML
jgi:hypothetical protein